MPRVRSMGSHFEMMTILTACMMTAFILATEIEDQKVPLGCFTSQCFLMTLESFGTFRSRWQAKGYACKLYN